MARAGWLGEVVSDETVMADIEIRHSVSVCHHVNTMSLRM